MCCIVLYCCIAMQWARAAASPMYCPIQQLYSTISLQPALQHRALGPPHTRWCAWSNGDLEGSHGAPMRHSLVRDIWVTITKVSQASESWSDHPRSALVTCPRRQPSTASSAAIQRCIRQYSVRGLRRRGCHAVEQYSAVLRCITLY